MDMKPVTVTDIQKYIDNGGKVTKCPPAEKNTHKQAIIRPVKQRSNVSKFAGMCLKCQHYNNGAGQNSCLSCRQYKAIVIQSGQRKTIAFEILPKAILENLADTKKMTEVIDFLQHLPLDKSVPITLYFILNATCQEIGDYLHISKQAVDKKIMFSLNMLKEMMKRG